ncbi:transposable element Tcb2 transposase [Trichonephila clavipes]|nr:transposable element Tcb2 transposase [Trichonephila clavipes]
MAGNTFPGLTSLVFQLNRADGQGDNLMNSRIQKGIVQAGGSSMMVWGVRSWRDVSLLIRLDTTLTGGRYVSILSDHLHLFMFIVHSDGLGKFHQDSATPHTSRIAKEWLKENSSELKHFHWPPKSPDMTIIKYIWDALERGVQKRSPLPLTPADLWTVLQHAWYQLSLELLQTIIESVHRSIARIRLPFYVLVVIRDIRQYIETFVIPLDKLQKALNKKLRTLHTEEAFNGYKRMTKHQVNVQDTHTSLGGCRQRSSRWIRKNVAWCFQIWRSVVE